MPEIENELEFNLFCDDFERRYDESNEMGIFEVLKIIELDTDNSPPDLVKAINYFKDKNGKVANDAPLEFLGEKERKAVINSGDFRPKLYVMFLSHAFSEALENKTAFLQHSFKYAFND